MSHISGPTRSPPRRNTIKGLISKQSSFDRLRKLESMSSYSEGLRQIDTCLLTSSSTYTDRSGQQAYRVVVPSCDIGDQRVRRCGIRSRCRRTVLRPSPIDYVGILLLLLHRCFGIRGTSDILSFFIFIWRLICSLCVWGVQFLIADSCRTSNCRLVYCRPTQVLMLLLSNRYTDADSK